MSNNRVSIAVVAPANRLAPEAAEKVAALAKVHYGARVRLDFHPQCFLSAGHFAGDDDARSAAFLEAANDPSFDAVWFARGGYGSCRLDDALFGKLNRAAHLKTYLGYSDMGFLLARLCREGVGRAVHGPMPTDINREGGEAAVLRALAFLVARDPATIEPAARRTARAYAFNLTTLSHLLGTAAEPDFTGAELMVEDVDEQHYRIDRALQHVLSSPAVQRIAGLRLGRMSKIPPNDPPFGQSLQDIVKYWCKRTRVAYLGGADIGHDIDNKIVQFPSSAVSAVA